MSRTGVIVRGTNAPDPWRRAGFRITIMNPHTIGGAYAF
jgi:hypothetical protein